MGPLVYKFSWKKMCVQWVKIYVQTFYLCSQHHSQRVILFCSLDFRQSSTYIHIYIYIYRERERERERYMSWHAWGIVHWKPGDRERESCFFLWMMEGWVRYEYQGCQYRTGGGTDLATGTIYFGYRSIPVYRFGFTAILYIYVCVCVYIYYNKYKSLP